MASISCCSMANASSGNPSSDTNSVSAVSALTVPFPEGKTSTSGTSTASSSSSENSSSDSSSSIATEVTGGCTFSTSTGSGVGGETGSWVGASCSGETSTFSDNASPGCSSMFRRGFASSVSVAELSSMASSMASWASSRVVAGWSTFRAWSSGTGMSVGCFSTGIQRLSV